MAGGRGDGADEGGVVSLRILMSPVSLRYTERPCNECNPKFMFMNIQCTKDEEVYRAVWHRSREKSRKEIAENFRHRRS